MSWSNRQKYLVHLYKSAAELTDADYRHVLYEVSGCRTAAHRGLTQWHFDHIMARLEGLLWMRTQEGIVPAPDREKIPDLHHWRSRLPRDGEISSRHAHRIRELWAELVPLLPAEHRTDDYLLGIAHQACGVRVRSIWELHGQQAGYVLDALRDRLSHAIRRGDTDEIPQPAEVHAG